MRKLGDYKSEGTNIACEDKSVEEQLGQDIEDFGADFGADF